MATIKRFEEMEIWQLAKAQCAAFFKLEKNGHLAGRNALKDQMDRSSGSVMDNIAEGFDRHSRADFRHFLVIGRGSNAEFRSQLYRCQDRSIILEPEFQKLKEANEDLGIRIHHFINYLTHTDHKHKPLNSTPPVKKRNLEEPPEDYLLQTAPAPLLPYWF